MYSDIIQFLTQKRLKEALVQLSALTSDIPNWKLQSEVENLQTTYGYMLQYAAQGVADPEREKLYQKLLRKAYELADEGEYVRALHKEYGYLADKFRLYRQSRPHSFGEISLALETYSQDMGMLELTSTSAQQRSKQQETLIKRHEVWVDELFYKVWTATHWSEEEELEARELMQSPMVPVNDLAVFLSAVTLNLLQIFDAAKFRLLIHTCQVRTEPLLTQRALVGIVLAAYYQEQRLSLYPELNAALSLLGESEEIRKNIYHIQIQLLLSRETEKINKKMREEIIPQIIKKTKFNDTDFKIKDIEDLEDANPEWEKEMNEIKDSIMELSELQMEGADTYMGAFAQFKDYPFFREAAHWFYPFDKQTSAIAESFTPEKFNENSFIGILLSSPLFCNSDKYSFAIALNSFPEAERNRLMTDISAQDESLKDNLSKTLINNSEESQRNSLCKQYIQDLYRFFKLWIHRKNIHDIFEDKLTLWKCAALNTLTQDMEKLKQTAEYLFSKNYYEEAGELFQELCKHGLKEAAIYQKIGFCLQKQKWYNEAIQSFLQADLLKPDHIWTLKHLAQCHKRIQEYDKALEYFLKVETMQPDNLNVLLQIGQCLATMRKYDKALSYFFKVEYLDKTPANAQRAIGWCYFMTGKYQEAVRFYRKLIENREAQSSDWLNCGHVYLAMGLIPDALACYREVDKLCQTHEEFITLFQADTETLLAQKVEPQYIYLIPDLI